MGPTWDRGPTCKPSCAAHWLATRSISFLSGLQGLRLRGSLKSRGLKLQGQSELPCAVPVTGVVQQGCQQTPALGRR